MAWYTTWPSKRSTPLTKVRPTGSTERLSTLFWTSPPAAAVCDGSTASAPPRRRRPPRARPARAGRPGPPPRAPRAERDPAERLDRASVDRARQRSPADGEAHGRVAARAEADPGLRAAQSPFRGSWTTCSLTTGVSRSRSEQTGRTSGSDGRSAPRRHAPYAELGVVLAGGEGEAGGDLERPGIGPAPGEDVGAVGRGVDVEPHVRRREEGLVLRGMDLVPDDGGAGDGAAVAQEDRRGVDAGDDGLRPPET